MSDKIESQIGPLKDNIRASFTDSMELEGANWTSDMAEEFLKRYGYDITDYLPFILFKIGSMGSALNYDPVVPVTDDFQKEIQRARYDFEDFKAQLMQERFTDTYINWCHHLDVKRIGICFDFQLVDEVPSEPFDIRMDEVISL